MTSPTLFLTIGTPDTMKVITTATVSGIGETIADTGTMTTDTETEDVLATTMIMGIMNARNQ
jgi:hypothetical protein